MSHELRYGMGGACHAALGVASVEPFEDLVWWKVCDRRRQKLTHVHGRRLYQSGDVAPPVLLARSGRVQRRSSGAAAYVYSLIA
jgi:hypothetical protein